MVLSPTTRRWWRLRWRHDFFFSTSQGVVHKLLREFFVTNLMAICLNNLPCAYNTFFLCVMFVILFYFIWRSATHKLNVQNASKLKWWNFFGIMFIVCVYVRFCFLLIISERLNSETELRVISLFHCMILFPGISLIVIHAN